MTLTSECHGRWGPLEDPSPQGVPTVDVPPDRTCSQTTRGAFARFLRRNRVSTFQNIQDHPRWSRGPARPTHRPPPAEHPDTPRTGPALGAEPECAGLGEVGRIKEKPTRRAAAPTPLGFPRIAGALPLRLQLIMPCSVCGINHGLAAA
ncbi:uncharacterized protein LOC116545219 [Sapajus apella]|uniref:Uncharacterized protein LOC116545219 n=1 Tax=Sapajus apella TaxID=9515 RepID=A0A6J3HBZ8_SAPAP|nr:uncharacterized protein LOC116545219 [Sapajus apella]